MAPAGSGLRGDRDPAARLLHESDANSIVRQLERSGDVVANLNGEGLAERDFVAEVVEVELDRLRLEAQRVGLVVDLRAVHVGLARDRADGGELVAVELDARDARV